MAPLKPSPKYRIWLAAAIEDARVSKREVARRMAANHPRGVTPDTIETGRRTINKILSGDLTPTQPTRDSIAASLGRVDAPTVDDDADEEIEDLAATLQALAREQTELSKRMERVMRQVRV